MTGKVLHAEPRFMERRRAVVRSRQEIAAVGSWLRDAVPTVPVPPDMAAILSRMPGGWRPDRTDGPEDE